MANVQLHPGGSFISAEHSWPSSTPLQLLRWIRPVLVSTPHDRTSVQRSGTWLLLHHVGSLYLRSGRSQLWTCKQGSAWQVDKAVFGGQSMAYTHFVKPFKKYSVSETKVSISSMPSWEQSYLKLSKSTTLKETLEHSLIRLLVFGKRGFGFWGGFLPFFSLLMLQSYCWSSKYSERIWFHFSIAM